MHKRFLFIAVMITISVAGMLSGCSSSDEGISRLENLLESPCDKVVITTAAQTFDMVQADTEEEIQLVYQLLRDMELTPVEPPAEILFGSEYILKFHLEGGVTQTVTVDSQVVTLHPTSAAGQTEDYLYYQASSDHPVSDVTQIVSRLVREQMEAQGYQSVTGRILSSGTADESGAVYCGIEELSTNLIKVVDIQGARVSDMSGQGWIYLTPGITVDVMHLPADHDSIDEVIRAHTVFILDATP